MDREAWQATVHVVSKSRTRQSKWAHNYISIVFEKTLSEKIIQFTLKFIQSEYYFHFIKGQVTQQHPNSHFNSQAYICNYMPFGNWQLSALIPHKVSRAQYVHQVKSLLSCNWKKMHNSIIDYEDNSWNNGIFQVTGIQDILKTVNYVFHKISMSLLRKWTTEYSIFQHWYQHFMNFQHLPSAFYNLTKTNVFILFKNISLYLFFLLYIAIF